MSSAIVPLEATMSVSAWLSEINESFAARHSLDITTVDNAASPYTVIASDQMIVVDASAGAVTINLPSAAASAHRSIHVIAKNVTGGNVTIDGSGSETINGATTLVLSSAYAAKRLTCDGAGWLAW